MRSSHGLGDTHLLQISSPQVARVKSSLEFLKRKLLKMRGFSSVSASPTYLVDPLNVSVII